MPNEGGDIQKPVPETAKVEQALGPITVNGRWAGSAFANPAFDLNGDGIAARTAQLTTYDQLPFAAIEGVLDTTLVALPGMPAYTCPQVFALQLRALGKITFRGRLGDALYGDVDVTAPDLCFDPSDPNESVGFVLSGGTGVYQNATGTATLTFHDTSRIDRPVSLPGFPPNLPAPLFEDSRGEFTLTVRL